MSDIENVLKERGAAYGDFASLACLEQELKEALRSGTCWRGLCPATRTSLDMIVHKLARVLNGPGEVLDNFVDLVGYAELALREVRNRHEEILNSLSYDPETGHFVWKDPKSRSDLKGKRAEKLHNNGYLYIKVQQKTWAAGRLAWFMQTRVLPHDSLVIDHINGDKKDNRWINLRAVTLSQNSHNEIRPANSVGFAGVSLHKKTGLYRSRITVQGKTTTKYFENPEDAHNWYMDEKRKVSPEYIARAARVQENK